MLDNLRDFSLKKGLEHLHAVRKRVQAITDHFAGFQAHCLNVHADFPLVQRIALPVSAGTVRYPGIRVHGAPYHPFTVVVLLHGGTIIGGWNSAALTSFRLAANNYGLNQLR